MDKIVIVGSPGSGKTTLALRLGKILGIEVRHLDHHFWQPDWKEKPRHIRRELLAELVQQKQWIIEGTYISSSEPRLNKADTIIFLDIPFWLCLLRIIHRHYKYRGKPRYDLPDGCSDNLNLRSILKVLVFPVKGRIELIFKLRTYKSKRVIRLRSDKKIEEFLIQQQQRTNGAIDSRILSPTVAFAYAIISPADDSQWSPDGTVRDLYA